jgi:hypothetical protein
MKTIALAMLRRCLCTSVLAAALAPAFAADNPFVGHWALTIPGGGAGWLGITQEKGYFDGGLLWGGGSVVPVDSVFFTDDTMFVIRINEVRRKDATGKTVRTQRFPETLVARVDGDELSLTRYTPRDNGQGVRKEEFTGKRTPPPRPAPDLSQVKFGEPITLFNGRDLTGWKTMGSPSGWRAENGLLVNEAKQEPGKHIAYANLRTEREFEDFNLTLEARVQKGGNSGIYLRGIYEVQVADSYGRPPDSHGIGGVYSRITPTENPAKPPGEWQSFDITLVDRHITVVLNGKKIIDNQPVLGCTGGALWSDPFRPGPLYLQGDHTSVDYRNIVLRPVVK